MRVYQGGKLIYVYLYILPTPLIKNAFPSNAEIFSPIVPVLCSQILWATLLKVTSSSYKSQITTKKRRRKKNVFQHQPYISMIQYVGSSHCKIIRSVQEINKHDKIISAWKKKFFFCLPPQSVTSVGATNSGQINPISVPNDTKDTACAEQIESKQTTRTTPDKFAPNGKECVQPSSSSSVVIQSPTQHQQTRLCEPTANDAECKKTISMDQQQQQRFRQNDENGSRNVDTKIDAESGNVQRTAEEKSKEEVVILSTEKSSNFSKTATISTISDVHVAGDTVNRYADLL